MKKLFLAIALLVSSSALFAQPCMGGLTIDNSQGKCGVWIKMLATDPFSGDPGTCGLNSVTFLVPPLSIWTWNSVYDFQGPLTCGMAGPGIYSPGWAFGLPILPGSPSFQWTDVTFQFDKCGSCSGGGNMSNNAGCGPSCWFAPQVWAAPPPCPNTAQWNPVCLPVTGPLVLTFHS